MTVTNSTFSIIAGSWPDPNSDTSSIQVLAGGHLSATGSTFGSGFNLNGGSNTVVSGNTSNDNVALGFAFADQVHGFQVRGNTANDNHSGGFFVTVWLKTGRWHDEWLFATAVAVAVAGARWFFRGPKRDPSHADPAPPANPYFTVFDTTKVADGSPRPRLHRKFDLVRPSGKKAASTLA